MPGQLIQPGIGLTNQRLNGSVSTSKFEFVDLFLPLFFNSLFYLYLTQTSDVQGTDTSSTEASWTTVNIQRHQPQHPERKQWSQHVLQPEPIQNAHDRHGTVQYAHLKM